MAIITSTAPFPLRVGPVARRPLRRCKCVSGNGSGCAFLAHAAARFNQTETGWEADHPIAHCKRVQMAYLLLSALHNGNISAIRDPLCRRCPCHGQRRSAPSIFTIFGAHQPWLTFVRRKKQIPRKARVMGNITYKQMRNASFLIDIPFVNLQPFRASHGP